MTRFAAVPHMYVAGISGGGVVTPSAIDDVPSPPMIPTRSRMALMLRPPVVATAVCKVPFSFHDMLPAPPAAGSPPPPEPHPTASARPASASFQPIVRVFIPAAA